MFICDWSGADAALADIEERINVASRLPILLPAGTDGFSSPAEDRCGGVDSQ